MRSAGRPTGAMRRPRANRAFGRAGLLAGLAAVSLLAGSTVAAPGTEAQPASESVRTGTVRLAVVGATQTGGFLNGLLAGFEADSGYQVDVFVGDGDALFERARAGQADLVVIHSGHEESFVRAGLGLWPKAVLATTVGFAVPPGDPAGVRTAADPVEAFERIAASQSPFVVNQLEAPVFLTETLWNAAGRPDRTGWFVDEPGLAGPRAAQRAAELGGYTIWGLHPMLTRPLPGGLQPWAFEDSLLQRITVSVAVNPRRFPYANVRGALALQDYLLAPETQASIRAFDHPAVDQPIFWPAGHQNVVE